MKGGQNVRFRVPFALTTFENARPAGSVYTRKAQRKCILKIDGCFYEKQSTISLPFGVAKFIS